MGIDTIMSTAIETLKALNELGRIHDRGLDTFKERDQMAYYYMSSTIMSIKLRRSGHRDFSDDWLSRTKAIASGEGYPTCSITRDDDSLTIAFTVY